MSGQERRIVTLHTAHLVVLVSLVNLPAVAAAVFLLFAADLSPAARFSLAALTVASAAVANFLAVRRISFSLSTVANVLRALQEGDYSMRMASNAKHAVLGSVFGEVNALCDKLREERLHIFESRILLRKVLREIDVAVFVFDDETKLELLNEAGERYLGMQASAALRQDARTLGLDECIEGATPRVLTHTSAGGAQRWELRRGGFREGGVPHQLLLLSDITRTLHNEERLAWLRIIRTLRHEINNSLAPISSIAESLLALLTKDPRPEHWEEDLCRGVEIIAGRSESLHTFIEAYSKIAQLPEPCLAPMGVRDWIGHTVALESNASGPIALHEGPDVTIRADQGQLEHLLINLVRNALEAGSGKNEGVAVGWSVVDDWLHVWVDDAGEGVANPVDCFTPLFSTKPGGEGIGLSLSRQIAEAHGGTLSLENHADGPGCRASLRLPMAR